MKRRNFISEGSRWLFLGGLLGTTGYLLYRRRFGDPEHCFANPLCKSCCQFGSCSVAVNIKPGYDEGQQGK